MTDVDTTSSVQDRRQGRGLLWAGSGLCVLGIALVAVQFGVVKTLFVPWYSPALATLGALLLVWSLAQRRTIARMIVLVLVAALAGFQWFFYGSMTKLPDYAGPAKEGARLPAFRTTLADGRTLSEQDLEDGTFRVLTFFRGRW
jgi:hypothetical protein